MKNEAAFLLVTTTTLNFFEQKKVFLLLGEFNSHRIEMVHRYTVIFSTPQWTTKSATQPF